MSDECVILYDDLWVYLVILLVYISRSMFIIITNID